jgi:hypothetical protein
MGRMEMRIGFDGEAGRKETLGNPRRGWVDNINIFLKEIGW